VFLQKIGKNTISISIFTRAFSHLLHIIYYKNDLLFVNLKDVIDQIIHLIYFRYIKFSYSFPTATFVNFAQNSINVAK
jgi:hypothetical protein